MTHDTARNQSSQMPGDNGAAVAAQFGISTKALRLYERLGMLSPPRTGAGWRVYGKVEVERLHAILSLKQLGLPLARIAELLKAGKTDLPALLDAQQAMLEEVRRETDYALSLVQVAKVRLRDRGELSSTELADLVQRISRTILRSTPELDALAERIYTPEQRGRMAARAPNEIAHASQIWEEVLAKLGPLAEAGDPRAPEALALGRKLVALFREQVKGDKEMWNNAYRFWQQAGSDPEIAPNNPIDRAQWDFIGAVFTELNARGEIKL